MKLKYSLIFLNIRSESVDNKTMRTLWKISTFLVLLFTLTACMPDSLTKFKEAPTKKVDDTTSAGGSGDDTEEEEVEIVTELTNLEIPQYADPVNGDLMLLNVDNIGTLKAGDNIFSSATMFKTTDKGAARIIQVAPDDTGTSGKLLVRITLAAAGVTRVFNEDDFIDNCSLGYANCAVGASTATKVGGTSFYFDPSGTPAFSRTLTVDSTNPVPIKFRVEPSLPLGVSLNEDTGLLQSPVVPFTIANTFDLEEFTFIAEVAEDNFGEILDEQETVSYLDSISSKVGSQATTISNYNFSYKLLNGDRILIKLANTTGIYTGDTLYSCISSTFTSCNSNTEYTGIGTVYHVDTENSEVYLTVADVNGVANPSEFLDGYYVHKSNGSLFTIQNGSPSRLYNSSSTGISFTPDWEVDPAGDGITVLFNINSLIPGMSIDTNTGVVSLTAPIQLSTENEYQVTAINSATGETISNYVFKLGVFDPPGGISYSLPTLNLGIGRDSIDYEPSLTPANFADAESVYYSVAGTIVSGISFEEESGAFQGVPNAYDAGTLLTISGFHPRSGSTAFASTTLTIKAGTPIDDFYYPQYNGEYLQLTVSDTSIFSLAQNISSNNGAQGTVSYINSDTSQIVVQVTANLTGNQVFKAGDTLDNASTYSFPKANLTNVVHIFNSAAGVASRVPALYNNSQAIALAGGEVVTYNVTPSLPADFSAFNTATGEIDGVSSLPLSLTSARTVNILLTNSIGEITTKPYTFLVKSAPIEATIGRYQFIRLSQNFNRFYIGTRFQTAAGIKGRVVHKIGDATTGGLLVEAQGTIEAGDQVDNVIPYHAAEGRVENYIFITLKDVTTLATSDTITTPDGDNATIVNVISAENKIYAKVNSGSFETGEIINASTATESIVMDVVTKHYASHILKLANAAAFQVGGYISSNTGAASADVIFKEDTNDYVYLQVISGAFSENSNVDDLATYAAAASTVNQVVGPIVTVTSSGNAGGNNVTSSTNPFAEGSTITADNGSHQSAGIVLDVVGNDFTIDVKDLKGTNAFEVGDDIDDATPFNSTLGSANSITAVSTTNIIPIYVGEETYIEGKVKGVFSDVSLTPDTLPSGLSFNSTTGVISGIPTEPQVKTTYTITYSSPGDADATFSFELITYNQFELIQETENASSFNLHKEGEGFGTTSCKILSSQVSETNDSNYQMNDVVCRLEAGELDLYNRGANLKVKSGAGMCEYVRYVPETHKSYPAGRTDSYYVQYSDFAGTCAGGISSLSIPDPLAVGGPIELVENAADNLDNIPINANGDVFFGRKVCLTGDCLERFAVSADGATSCQFDHREHQTGLNCDEGSNWVATVSCEEDDDTGACTCTSTDFVETRCGGSRYNCMSGAIKSTELDTENESSLIVNSFSGVTAEFPVDAPQSQGQYSNTIISNTTRATQCRDTAQNFAFDSYDNAGNLTTFISNLANYNQIDTTARGFWADLNPTGSSAMNSSKFYEYHCLDASYNIKARIRLQIRDWNESFNPETPEIEIFDNGGAIAGIDTSGANCFGIECDQRWDWDSLVDGLSAGSRPNYTVAAGSCSRGGNATFASTITTVAGSNILTVSGALGSDITIGSVIKVGANLAGNEFRYFTVTGYTSTTITTSTNADVTVSGLDWELIRDFPFPLDHTN
ncbi:hypothetical protein BIY24_15120 [Halobacteriovorax marinus]|nr:hypothetical protein BIY24_15120 [Halobacteriovorax marinus]